MVLFTGIGIAMKNAVPDLKNVADFVTDDIDEDGWAKAMAKYGLLD